MSSILLVDTTLGGVSISLMEVPESRAPIPHPLPLLGSEFKDNGSAVCIAETFERVLGKSGRVLQDIQAVGVSVGPGSFTGIKIGIAFAEGLATGSSRRIRLIGVSSLQSLGEYSAACGAMEGWFLPSAAEQGFFTIPVAGEQRLYMCRVEENQLVLHDGNVGLLGVADFFRENAKRVDIIGACPKIESRLSEWGIAVRSLTACDTVGVSVPAMADAVYRQWQRDACVDSLTPLYLRKSTPEEKLGVKGER